MKTQQELAAAPQTRRQASVGRAVLHHVAPAGQAPCVMLCCFLLFCSCTVQCLSVLERDARGTKDLYERLQQLKQLSDADAGRVEDVQGMLYDYKGVGGEVAPYNIWEMLKKSVESKRNSQHGRRMHEGRPGAAHRRGSKKQSGPNGASPGNSKNRGRMCYMKLCSMSRG